MANYLAPAAPVPSTWADHKGRNPPSSEPGTDYALAYGSPVFAAADATVFATYPNTGPAGNTVELRQTDGRVTRYLHLDSWKVSIGQKVDRGHLIALSGASGNGSPWFYGPHVHITLLPEFYTPLNQAIDFQRYVGTPPPPAPDPVWEEESMFRAKSDKTGTWYVIGEFSVTQIENGPKGSANWTHAVTYNDMMNGQSFPTVASDRIKLALADVDARIRDFLGRLSADLAAVESERIQTMIAAES